MISIEKKIIILSILLLICITLPAIISFSIKTVDPIPLSGYIDILNKTSYWEEFSDKQTNMVSVTCREWNKLPVDDRIKIPLRYTFFPDIIGCNPYNNQNYQSYIGIVYGNVIINLLLFIVLAYATSILTSTFYISSKILINTLNIFLLASLYIDVFLLTSTKKLHAASYGDVYDVKGYLNVSGYMMAINDQFQLSELSCKLYIGSPLPHVDVYLSNCSINNNFIYYVSIIMKLLTLILYIPCLIYVGIYETNKSNEYPNLIA